MKRKAHIFLIVLSLILTAVLITTCIFSGTFAKYSTSASDTATARVQKFGVTALVTTSNDFEKENKPIELPGTGQVDVSFYAADMRPGINLSDALKIQVYGKSETRVMLVIDLDIDFNESNFTYPQKVANSESTVDKLYFPVKYIGGKFPKGGTMSEATIFDARTVTSPTNANAIIDYKFTSAYANYLGMSVISSPFKDGGYAVAKIFEPGNDVTLAGYDPSKDNIFQLGFEWPFEDSAEINEIETWLTLNKTLNASFKFNIKIEQIRSDYSITVPTDPSAPSQN